MARKKKRKSSSKKKTSKKKKKTTSRKGKSKKGSKNAPPAPPEAAENQSSDEEAPAVAADDATEGDDDVAVDVDAESPDDEVTVIDLDAESTDDDVTVIDLDAEPTHDDVTVVDLDDDSEETDPAAAAAIDQLIAETMAAARAAEEALDTPDDPAIDLDAELEPAGDPVGAEAAVRELIDLGPVSSPEVRDRLLAEALAHAEHKDARYRVPFSDFGAATRWKALVATLLLIAAGLVALFPPQWVRPEPPASMDAAERAASLRSALLLQAQQVEAFRVRTQRLPASLDEVSRALPGVRYVRSGTRAYQLIAYEPNGNAIVYDSANPTPEFASVGTGWALSDGRP